MKLVFAGTPDFAACHLKYLLDHDCQIVSVWTQPDKPAKRGRTPQASPVKVLAGTFNLPLYQPPRINSSAIRHLMDLQADLMVVVAFGQILPPQCLEVPRLGCINVHTSILPRWRGAAPIQRAIGAGDAATGVTVMQMDDGLDTGSVLRVEHCAIDSRETTGSLTSKLEKMGPRLLLETINDLGSGGITPQPQTMSGVTYAHKISKDEAELNWQASAMDLDRMIRMLNPAPVAFSYLADLRVRIWQAEAIDGTATGVPGQILDLQPEGLLVACGLGALRITQLQIPIGKGKVVSPADLFNSRRDLFAPGKRLTKRILP